MSEDGSTKGAHGERTAYYGGRARIGLIVPPNNTVNEGEWASNMPAGVTFHASRLPLNPLARSEAERAELADKLVGACSMLAEAEIDVVVFGCTAPSAFSPRRDMEAMMAGAAGLPAVTAAAALVDAIEALGASKVALMSPFSEAVTQHERQFLEQEGIAVTATHSLGHGTYQPGRKLDIHRIAPEEVERQAAELDLSGTDALILSGTNLVTFPILASLEKKIGRPVVSSNQAMLWAALRKAGIADTLPLGSLFSA